MSPDPNIPDPSDLATSDLRSLAEVAAETSQRQTDHALEVARQLLGMDFSYLSEFVGDEQILRGTSGDGASFDMSVGDGYPLDGSYCQRMVVGQIPNLVPDSAERDELRDLALTKLAGIGSYVGVPVYLHDGRLYGTFSAISHDPRRQLGERHVQLMEVLGHIVASSIEWQRLEKENERLREKIAKMDTELDEAEGDRRLSRILMSGEFQAIPRGTPPPE
jgi:GAF domain-containing protein